MRLRPAPPSRGSLIGAPRANALAGHSETGTMVEINKLSVEKALEKMRSSDARQSRSAQFDEKIEALDEGIERMRAQRLRLERNHRKRDQDNP